jgi:hypothetical protein
MAAGQIHPWRSVVRIAVAETRMPSRSSFSRMRWAPQRGFSLANRTISCCSSWLSCGRPAAWYG